MSSRVFNSTTAVFAGTILLVAAWIGSGMLGGDDDRAAEDTAPPVPTVAASWSSVEPVERRLSLYGDVEPTQVAILRSRTDGLIESVAPQGTAVEAGDVLARLSTDDRQAQLARVRAQVASAERNYNAARQLSERGIGPDLEVEARLAELEAARAELQVVELDIANTAVTAPIAGTVNRVIADIGAYVSPGGEVLELVDNDPLIAVVQVQQGEVANVRVGMPALVRFIGGNESEGRVRFVSPLADAATRTFRVEIEIDNPGGEIPAGLSAEVEIVTATIEAHLISPALLRLDEQGRLGLYVVDGEDRIGFEAIEIVMADASGIWVTGPGDPARLITISQGAIAPGETVAVQETPEAYLSTVPGADAASDPGAPDPVDLPETP